MVLKRSRRSGERDSAWERVVRDQALWRSRHGSVIWPYGSTGRGAFPRAFEAARTTAPALDVVASMQHPAGSFTGDATQTPVLPVNSTPVPSPLRWRAVRLLSRWQTVRPRGPRIPVVALATALAMVSALILEPGISAHTPDDVSTSLATSAAGIGVPGTLFNRLDRIQALDGPGAQRVGPIPSSIVTLDRPLDIFLRAQDSDPAAYIEWMAREVALAQELAQATALTEAIQDTTLDPLISRRARLRRGCQGFVRAKAKAPAETSSATRPRIPTRLRDEVPARTAPGTWPRS